MAHSVATPALLCHKEPAQGTPSPLLGALGRNAPYYYYGIRIGVCTVGGGKDAPCLLADGWMALLVQGEEEEQERAGVN